MFGRLRRLERQLEASTQRLLDRMAKHEIQSRRDILNAADQRNALEAADFVAVHMPLARAIRDPEITLIDALEIAPDGGLALEFGVHRGRSLSIIAEGRDRRGVWGFDSFEGLPEDWRAGFRKGAFETDIPDVPGAELVVGWFDETLPGWLEDNPGPVDFLHIDCDLYSSTKTVLDLVGPRLRPGSIVVFDEFFNYTGWRDHEYRAWTEYVERSGVEFTYEAYCYRSEQVVVRIH